MCSLKISSIILLCFIFLGCSSKVPVIETKEVYIPVKCKAAVPNRPNRTGLVDRDVLNILEYTEQLEVVIEKCVDKE